MKRERSSQLFAQAKKLMPGGVNSPVRAFKSVKGDPLFIKKGQGSQLWDEDGHQFIDYCCSWGPLILGHAPPTVVKAIQETVAEGSSFGAPTALENELAALIISNHPYLEMIRFVSSGTEAVMSALRLARGVTKRDKIVKFEGCYHGHVDSLLVKAGSGLVTFGETTSAGVPASFAAETIVLPLDDEAAVRDLFQQEGGNIAAVIIEPIPANNGLLIQSKTFLELLRALCTQQGALLIFDEVISGFRVGFGGAAELYGIRPDIMTYGKIIGGGLPVGAYGASREIMENIAPLGPVYQAGTLSGNPVAMAAGIAQLTACLQPGFYADLQRKTTALVDQIREHIALKGYPVQLFSMGSIFWMAFTEQKRISRADQIDPQSMQFFKELHAYLLEQGVYFGPSGYEVGFVSAAHTDADIQTTIRVICEGLDVVFSR
jgi:glutamate-1-semialdehyde 2,1-aminomutase